MTLTVFGTPRMAAVMRLGPTEVWLSDLALIAWGGEGFAQATSVDARRNTAATKCCGAPIGEPSELGALGDVQ